jgi:WD40 repeat protein
MRRDDIIQRLILLSGVCLALANVNGAPIQIAQVSHTQPVDFPSEIFPTLKANCIACHNKTTTKGGLNMETPELMKKGGESGPAIEPGKGDASLLLQSAAHAGDSDMPPKGNKVGAVNLTPEELGLLKLWIDQGAVPGKKVEREIAWKPLPPGLNPIYSVALAPAGDLAACSRANQVFVYDLATRKQVAQIDAHRDMSLALAFSPDGSRIASGSFGEVKLWKREPAVIAPGADATRLMEAKTGIQELERKEALASLDVSFHASVVKSEDSEIFVLKDRVKKAGDAIPDAAKKLEEKRDTLAQATAARDVAQKILDELNAAIAKIPVDKPDAALVAKQEGAKSKLTAAMKAEMDAKTAARLAEAASANATAELPKVTAKLAETEKTAQTTKATHAAAQEAQKKLVESLAAARKTFAEIAQSNPTMLLSPDQRWLIESQAEGKVIVWTLPGGLPVAEFTPKPGATTPKLGWKPDNTLDVPAEGNLANLPPVWTLERTLGTGDAKSPIEDRVNAIAFNHDGTTVAVGSGEPSRGGDITLWNVTDGKLVRSLHDRHSDTVLSLDFSPDGKLIASGGADKQLRVSDVANSKQVKVFEGHTHHVMGVSWRADGRVLVSSGADNVTKVWDWVKGERRKNLEGWDKEVTSVRYLGATTRLLTTSGDKQVRLIGEDGASPMALSGTTDFMQAGAASRDGQWVAGGGEDSVLRVWESKGGAPIAEFTRP